jgi:hypothetical protein
VKGCGVGSGVEGREGKEKGGNLAMDGTTGRDGIAGGTGDGIAGDETDERRGDVQTTGRTRTAHGTHMVPRHPPNLKH